MNKIWEDFKRLFKEKYKVNFSAFTLVFIVLASSIVYVATIILPKRIMALDPPIKPQISDVFVVGGGDFMSSSISDEIHSFIYLSDYYPANLPITIRNADVDNELIITTINIIVEDYQALPEIYEIFVPAKGGGDIEVFYYHCDISGIVKSFEATYLNDSFKQAINDYSYLELFPLSEEEKLKYTNRSHPTLDTNETCYFDIFCNFIDEGTYTFRVDITYSIKGKSYTHTSNTITTVVVSNEYLLQQNVPFTSVTW